MKFTTKGNNSWLYNKAYYNGFDWQQKKKEDYAPDFFKNRFRELSSVKLVEKLPVKEQLKPLLLKTTYPGLVTGVGIKHETKSKGEHKLGFEFDYTTGMPVIRGHSLKGAIRSAFPQHQNEEVKYKKEKAFHIHCFINNKKPTKELFESFAKQDYKEVCLIEDEIFEGKLLNDKRLSLYERDIFYDAYIQQSNENNKYLGDDSITPHKNSLINPVPISFLKVLPEVIWAFYFDLKNSQINETLTSEKKYNLFKKILLHFGLGAKTNVGYGQFKVPQPMQNDGTTNADLVENPAEYKQNRTVEVKLIQKTEADIFVFKTLDNSDTFHKPVSYFLDKYERKKKRLEKKGRQVEPFKEPTIGEVFSLVVIENFIDKPFKYRINEK